MYYYNTNLKNIEEELPSDDASTTIERSLNGKEDDIVGFF